MVEVEDGSSISLDCLVFLKQDKTVGRPARCSRSSPPQVSWLRQTGGSTAGLPDLLTVGSNTYTGDARVRADFVYPNNW